MPIPPLIEIVTAPSTSQSTVAFGASVLWAGVTVGVKRWLAQITERAPTADDWDAGVDWGVSAFALTVSSLLTQDSLRSNRVSNAFWHARDDAFKVQLIWLGIQLVFFFALTLGLHRYRVGVVVAAEGSSEHRATRAESRAAGRTKPQPSRARVISVLYGAIMLWGSFHLAYSVKVYEERYAIARYLTPR